MFTLPTTNGKNDFLNKQQTFQIRRKLYWNRQLKACLIKRKLLLATHKRGDIESGSSKASQSKKQKRNILAANMIYTDKKNISVYKNLKSRRVCQVLNKQFLKKYVIKFISKCISIHSQKC